MAFDPRKPPSLAAANHLANEIQAGLSGKGRASDLRVYLQQAEDWMRFMASQEEREFAPQLLLDLYEMFTALKEAGIAGVVRLLIAPPGDDLPGKYSVETDFGKLTGEASQLANTIGLLGKALGAGGFPPGPPEEEHREPPTDEPAEASRSIH